MIGAKNCYMSSQNVYGSFMGKNYDYDTWYGQQQFTRDGNRIVEETAASVHNF